MPTVTTFAPAREAWSFTGLLDLLRSFLSKAAPARQARSATEATLMVSDGNGHTYVGRDPKAVSTGYMMWKKITSDDVIGETDDSVQCIIVWATPDEYEQARRGMAVITHRGSTVIRFRSGKRVELPVGIAFTIRQKPSKNGFFRLDRAPSEVPLPRENVLKFFA